MPSVTVSAPGKVLLAGGYLVLESPNVGLVVAANKRFYCTIEGSDDKDSRNDSTIVVHSPQFHSEWEYRLSYAANEDGTVEVGLHPSPENSSSNGFIEKTIRLTMAYIIGSVSTGGSAAIPSTIKVTIRADNDFYSLIPHLKERGLDRTPENVESLPRFLPCPQDEEGKPIVNKTGLGSSAALVTSCVGALLEFFGLRVGPRALNLAQISHCHAQGKVGSGFDVSAAVHGSHIYRRFPKCTLPDVLHQLQNGGEMVSSNAVQLLKTLVESDWDGGVVSPLQIPHGLQLLLADVCGGSESPSMARKVLSWKTSREAPDEQPFWENLAEINPRIIDRLQVDISVEECATTTAAEWQGSHPLLFQLHEALVESRSSLKAMGEAAGVPIEPDEQSRLANATQKLPGVVVALVPGAGGYDAMACLHVDQDSVRENIGKVWSTWEDNGASVCPLSVRAAAYGEGLRVEPDFQP